MQPKLESALKMARELGEQYWIGTWLSNLALASIGRKDFDAAQRYNDEALRMNQSAGGGFGAYARVNRAQTLEGSGDREGAESRRDGEDARGRYVLGRPLRGCHRSLGP